MYVPSRVAGKKLDIHPNTLKKLADNGKIPHYITEHGQRKYDVDAYLGIKRKIVTVCYCRVSRYKQKDDLERQVPYMSNK